MGKGRRSRWCRKFSSGETEDVHKTDATSRFQIVLLPTGRYHDDFGVTSAEFCSTLAKFCPEQEVSDILMDPETKIAFADYDWRTNIVHGT